MANLLPPRIKGPVSECSSHIRVRSQFVGAQVEVVDINTGNIVASGTASSADQAFNVTGALIPGNELAARQQIGPDASGLSADTVQVQARSDPVGPVSFRTPIMECGRCLWLEGLVPGADVEITDNGVPIGSGHSHDGVARVGLSQPIGATSNIEAQQTACGIPGDTSTAPPPLPSPGGREQGRVLPPPSVEFPLIECANRVTVSGALPGARVELQRSSGFTLGACFDLPSLWFGVNPPLALSESVMARQLFPDCEKESDWSDPVIVGPLEPVPIPTVQEPLCKGGTNVRVCNLMAGARVRITVAGKPHHGGFPVGGTTYEAIAPDDGCFDFALAAPGLPGDSVVYATQELCSRESDPSNVAEVEPAPASLPKPEVQDPLFECSTIVHVENLHPGTQVCVYKESIGQIGCAYAYTDEVDVVVAPGLMAGDVIYAIATGCGHTSPESDRVEVKELEGFEPPVVEPPVYSCETTVSVSNVLPGAWVDIFVDGAWRGRKRAGTDEVEVPVQIGSLEVGDQVTAIQSLCDRVSEPSRPETVVEFKGRWVRIGGEDKSSILAVHAALLHTGKILIFAGDEYTGANRLPNTPNIDHTVLMDAHPPYGVKAITGLPPEANFFCTGHSMLEDGTVLVAGGTERAEPQDETPDSSTPWHHGHWYGPRESWRFLPEPIGSEKWDVTGMLVTARSGDVRSGYSASETGGRWYPTLFTLPNGKVLALGGHPLEGDARHTNLTLELFDPASNSWDYVGTVDYSNIPGAAEVPWRGNHSEYPRGHVLRDGTLFIASNMADRDVYKWHPYTDPENWTRVADEPSGYSGNPQPYSTVLLPLSYENEYAPRVMIFGGDGSPNPTPKTIDPLSSTPTWNNISGRVTTKRRVYPLMTLLPSSEVFIYGGTETQQDVTGVREAETYNPSSGVWKEIPPTDGDMPRVRNYHSTALLLPNGAVWHSGSNENCMPGLSTRDRTVEIFEPWYFCHDRPRIEGVTSRVCHGGRLHIETRDAALIDRVVLVRTSTFTHAFNPDQRLVHVPHIRDENDANLIIATLPSNAAVLIPGYYLVFIVTADGVPSVGKFVQVCRSSTSSPGWVIDRDWWKKFIELLIPLQIDPDILDQLRQATANLKIEPARTEAPLRVVLEKIQILDDQDFFGKGEFQFRVKVHSRNMGGQYAEVRVPGESLMQISDRPGRNIVELHREVFRGRVVDHLAIEVIAAEHDLVKTDLLPPYRRVFEGPTEGWLGAYAPSHEVIDLETPGLWRIWYRIEKV